MVVESSSTWGFILIWFKHPEMGLVHYTYIVLYSLSLGEKDNQ